MISLPFKPKIVSEDGHKAVIDVEGLYPGYGQTIGNSLRRVLLSSLKGAAITSVKIERAGHEFSTLEGVMENVVEIILNLKLIRFRLHEDGPFTINLSVSGEKEVKAEDFKTPSQVEVMNPDVCVATLTSKKSKLSMEAVVEAGFGYVPVEARSKEKVEIGVVALDAAFSPVRKVNYVVENMRVGDRTDYNRVRFQMETDGSISSVEAFQRSAQILVEQFKSLSEGFTKTDERDEAEQILTTASIGGGEEKHEETFEEGRIAGQEEAMRNRLDDLRLSSRTLNALREAGIKTIGGLSRKKEAALREIDGLGDKGIQEIKKELGNFGITLKK